MSTAKPQTAPDFPESAIICYDSGFQPPAPWLDQLKVSLQGVTASPAEVEPLGSFDAHEKICIFLDDTEQSILTQPTSAQFGSLKASLLCSRGVFWISSQATGDCQKPKAALSTGFLRTLRAENRTKRYISLDIANKDPWTAGAVNSILKTYTTAFDYSQHTSSLDSEFVVSGDTIKVPRLYEAPAETQAMTMEVSDFESALEPFHQPGRELRMDIKIPGMIDSLCWHDDSQADLPLPDGWLEIKPRAFGLSWTAMLWVSSVVESSRDQALVSQKILRLAPACVAPCSDTGGLMSAFLGQVSAAYLTALHSRLEHRSPWPSSRRTTHFMI